jgi:tRNA-Thr(GGU) m(6)t(6)A37 methyltransferase TsaA
MEKKLENIVYRPIGIIHTPFRELENMPIQPSGAAGICGTVELYPEFAEGLKDLDGFSHLILLYRFHESRGYSLTVTPFLDSETRGVFATRAPKRPNPIGLSIVRLVRIQGSTLDIENVDILDRTPLLDIKPYVPEFDHQQDCRIGWLEQVHRMVKTKRSDDRFRKDE